MKASPETINELRAMFKTGATPSRLIRHIAERHEPETGLHALIQEYFREAFGIPILRGLRPLDDYRQADMRYSFLNEQLLHEMIAKRSEWDQPDAFGAGGEISWLEPLRAQDDLERIKQVQPASFPDLSQSWSKLTPKEQLFIQQSIASANGLYETVKILARLAERLQEQVLELEERSLARAQDRT